MKRIAPMLVSLALTTSLVVAGPFAPVPAQAQAPDAQPGAGPPAPLVERARADLARRLGMDPAHVTLAEAVPMTWSSLALGCPAPGMAYGAVQTPGFRLELDAIGQRYAYHTDTRETMVACIQGAGVPDGQVLSAGGLLAALLERGVSIEVVDARAEVPFLRADGTRYRLSVPTMPAGSEIQVYDYRDPVTAAADAAAIGPDGQPTAGSPSSWPRPPIYYRSGGVVVLTFDGARPLVALLEELLGPPFAGEAGVGMPPPAAGSPPQAVPGSPPVTVSPPGPSSPPQAVPGSPPVTVSPPGPGSPPADMPPASPPTGNTPPPSSHPPTDPSVRRVTWDEAVGLITGGMVTQAFQTHALEVRLNLTDGTSVVTTEPRIDEVFRVIRQCGDPCKDIIIATE